MGKGLPLGRSLMPCVCVSTLLLKKVEVTLYVHICGVLVLVRAWSNHVPWSWATWRPCDTHRRAGGASFHGFLPEKGKALRNASISLNASLQFIPNQAHGGRGDHLFHIRKGVCEPTTAFMQMTSIMFTTGNTDVRLTSHMVHREESTWTKARVRSTLVTNQCDKQLYWSSTLPGWVCVLTWTPRPRSWG